MEKFEMLKKLSAADFSAFDLRLYLNTHPHDREAIKLFNAANTEAKKLHAEYEKKFGRLTASGGEPYTDYFDWIDNPWPWDREFNEM
jgi:spore coat protein JB